MAPMTRPFEPRSIKSLAYYIKRTFYYLVKTKPWLWCLTMTVVGMSDIYKHFLIIFFDGVRPPIYNAETNYIRFPPWFEIVLESCGLVEITSNIISWFIYNSLYYKDIYNRIFDKNIYFKCTSFV